MAKNHKNYTAEEKAKIALEALKGQMTISEISSKYKVHSTQISNWKQRLKTGIAAIFSDTKRQKEADQTQLLEELYGTIGRQKIEIEWLKKKSELFKS